MLCRLIVILRNSNSFVFWLHRKSDFKIGWISAPLLCVCVRERVCLCAACSSCSSSAPSPLSFPLTDQTAIALSNPSGLWKHTPRYISFEEITGSLMKYADNKRERGAGVRMTWQAIARGALVKNVQLEQSAKQASTVIKGPCVRITHSM